MTSNAGARQITEQRTGLGFSAGQTDAGDFEKTKELVMGELKNLFKPEFLNRVDDIIVFHKLTEENTAQIAEKMLRNLASRLQEMEIRMVFTSQAVAELAHRGFDPVYGARPLRRTIQSIIEDTISEKMLEGTITAGKRYQCDFADGEFTFTEQSE